MHNDKTPIFNADSYEAIGDFWDANDLGEHWDSTRSAQFEVLVEAQRNYVPVETNLTQQLRAAAQRNGVSVESLVNGWLQERLSQEVGA